MHHWCHKIACLRPMLAYVAGLLIQADSWRLAFTCFLLTIWLLIVHRYLSVRTASLWFIRWMPGTALMCCWLGVGLLVGYRSGQSTVMPEGFGKGAPFHASVEVTVEPQERNKTWKLGVRVRETSEQSWLNRKLVVYIPKGTGVEQLRMGDRLWMEIAPALPEAGGLDGFDYLSWLRNKGYTATAFVGKWEKTASAPFWNLNALCARLQQSLVAVYQQTDLPHDSKNLVSAMTLGARESLSGELNDDFSRAGVNHILSVSGLHVAIVFALMRFSLFFMGYPPRMRRLRDIVIVCCLWGFALVTGCSPAVCRAVLMATMLVLAGLLGRGTSSLNTVLFSAWLQLLVNPLLLYDIGFQLSYLAVIGLVLYIPLMKRIWCPSSRVPRYLWDLVSMSLAAQLLTTPLTIHYFGQFPRYFLLSNLLAVPLSGMLMYVAVACLLSAPIPWLFQGLSQVLSLCSSLFVGVVHGVAHLPGSVLEGLDMSIISIPVVYVLIVCLTVWLVKRRTVFLRFSLVSLIVLQCLFLWEKCVGI